MGAGLAYRGVEEPDLPPESTTFVVTGEVFLVLDSGETQHAPGARVYVLEESSAGAGDWVMGVVEAAISEGKDKRQAVRQLRKTIESVVTEELLRDKEHAWSMNCDSMGRFRIGLPRGSYVIVATGRAGSRESVWWEKIDVPTAQIVSLSEPAAMYLASSRQGE